jgi:hypothetical protein
MEIYSNIIKSFYLLSVKPCVLFIALHNYCKIFDCNDTEKLKEDCVGDPCYFAVCINLAAKYYVDPWFPNDSIVEDLQKHAEVSFSLDFFNAVERTIFYEFDYEFRPPLVELEKLFCFADN